MFQFVLLNGTLQFVAARDVIDLSTVQVLVTDSLGVPQLFNLTASGFLVGLFEPGQASVLVVESTLPAGISLVAGTNPTLVMIPSNGIVQGSIVFAQAATSAVSSTTATATTAATATTTTTASTTSASTTASGATTAPPTSSPPPPPTGGSVTEINFYFKDILGNVCACGVCGGSLC